MRDGFISVAAGTPKIRVADCRYNAEQIFTLMREADKQGVKVLALPELCLTGYTCGDLFLQDTLLRGAEEGLQTILEATRNLEIVTALGLPVWDKWDNKLYNCAAIIQKGEILGLIPKVYLPNYGEFYEQRWFASGSGVEHGIELCGQHVSLCTNQTFACDTMPNLVIGVEICEDLWAPAPPSVELARKGATVILNLSASNELVGKADYRRSLVTGQSARLMCGYVYADAGEGESTTDVVFTGHNMIAENGTLLAERMGATLKIIDISQAVRRHFTDIGQSMENHDVTFENGQARERTQVLMDIANQTGGLVIGTGDLSELALGWCTYNGDHMSNYAVNCSIPKTLVRHLVAYLARDNAEKDEALHDVLEDILDTPVSPELLPAVQGEISQRTEDLVGPYELHDFFLYYMLRWGFPPRKIYRLALYALGKTYTPDVILKWLKTFYRRFFSQQFKRSCLPDGPKVGSAALSPRGDWRMPSDASAALWQAELETLE